MGIKNALFNLLKKPQTFNYPLEPLLRTPMNTVKVSVSIVSNAKKRVHPRA